MDKTSIKAVGLHVVDCKNPNMFKLVFTNGAGTEISAMIDSDTMLVVSVEIGAISKLKPVKELLENILEKENKNND